MQPYKKDEDNSSTIKFTYHLARSTNWNLEGSLAGSASPAVAVSVKKSVSVNPSEEQHGNLACRICKTIHSRISQRDSQIL
jgi:hypothetical protein